MNSAEPPNTVVGCPLSTESLNLAERGQKRPLILCNLNTHNGRLSMKGWDEMLFAAEGQLDRHPIPQYGSHAQRVVSRIEEYSRHRPGASAWIARPGQSAHFMIPDRNMTSGHHMYDAGFCKVTTSWQCPPEQQVHLPCVLVHFTDPSSAKPRGWPSAP